MTDDLSDVEINRRCAKKIGINVLTVKGGNYVERPEKEVDYLLDGVYEYDAGSNMWSRRYDPLHNDAQAMALVKKFPEECLEAMSEHLSSHALSPLSPELDLNRAICLCVASMP